MAEIASGADGSAAHASMHCRRGGGLFYRLAFRDARATARIGSIVAGPAAARVDAGVVGAIGQPGEDRGARFAACRLEFRDRNLECLQAVVGNALQTSIDAISLSTVDAGVLGLDGALWTSDLGQRYLELQREATIRNVRIRRIFVVEPAAFDQDHAAAAGKQAPRRRLASRARSDDGNVSGNRLRRFPGTVDAHLPPCLFAALAQNIWLERRLSA